MKCYEDAIIYKNVYTRGTLYCSQRNFGYNAISDIGVNMFKKLTPLIILAMFIVGTYFMIQGMNKATALAHPQKTEKK
jgi:hypothetical protein